ncbi:MAG: hypothetical protein GXO43_06105 [Crenarchaeota archaeon]|nr:hypothetical protein [Thermoproteota archaeon]
MSRHRSKVLEKLERLAKINRVILSVNKATAILFILFNIIMIGITINYGATAYNYINTITHSNPNTTVAVIIFNKTIPRIYDVNTNTTPWPNIFHPINNTAVAITTDTLGTTIILVTIIATILYSFGILGFITLTFIVTGAHGTLDIKKIREEIEESRKPITLKRIAKAFIDCIILLIAFEGALVAPVTGILLTNILTKTIPAYIGASHTLHMLMNLYIILFTVYLLTIAILNMIQIMARGIVEREEALRLD